MPRTGRRAARTIVVRWTNRAGGVTLTACHGAFMSTATLLLFILASAVAIVTPAPPCCWP